MSELSRQYHHGDLKAAIMQRAAEIIEADGIEALSLRAIARDLDVSHGAPNRHFKTKADLLAALATEGWDQIRAATLAAADYVSSGDARDRLHAMGKGFLLWALENRSLFRAVTHPDVERYADDELRMATASFQKTVRDAVESAQASGRHPDIDLKILTLYTNSVPFGLSMMLSNNFITPDMSHEDIDDLAEQLIDLVVPRTN